MRILFDITRLAALQHMSSATGIDRVDLAYAHYLRKLYPTQVEYVMAFPFFGLRTVSQSRANALIDRLFSKWSNGTNVTQEKTTKPLVCKTLTFDNYLDNHFSQQKPSGKKLNFTKAKMLLGVWSMIPVFRPIKNQNDKFDETHYINTSHTFVHMNSAFEWSRKQNIKHVFFIHDLIPITHPEYCGAKAKPKHMKRLENVSKIASGIIVNSKMTESAVKVHMDSHSLSLPHTLVAHLGIEEDKHEAHSINIKSDRPFFLFVSTIEARKNHAFILALWRELVEKYGEKTPKLLVIGRRGWESESAIDLLERCEALKGTVFELGVVDEAELDTLKQNATGMIMPSYVEGFSYSVAEAINSNIPAVVSDIPVHRELAEGKNCNVQFCGALDAPAWEQAIMNIANGTPEVKAEDAQKNYFPWNTHFQLVDSFLKKLG